MGGDEPQLAGGVGVAAARHEHRSESADRGLAGGPLGERQERVARAAASVLVDRSRVAGGESLGLGQLLRLAPLAGSKRLEEGAVGLLGRMREATAETAEQDRRPSFDDGKGVAPEPQGEPEAEVGRRRAGSGASRGR